MLNLAVQTLVHFTFQARVNTSNLKVIIGLTLVIFIDRIQSSVIVIQQSNSVLILGPKWQTWCGVLKSLETTDFNRSILQINFCLNIWSLLVFFKDSKILSTVLVETQCSVGYSSG